MFQKIKDWEIECWVRTSGLRVSMKAEKLHTAEAERNRANTLSTRLLACCKTSINKAVKARQLMSGIKPHKFIPEFPSDTQYYVLLPQL